MKWDNELMTVARIMVKYETLVLETITSKERRLKREIEKLDEDVGGNEITDIHLP